jgi:hypothetical protein
MLVTGQPTLDLQVGDQIRSARYIGRLAGSNATLSFRYVVQAGDTDTDGVAISANAIRVDADASIKDLYGNPATLSHSAVAAATLAKVDTTAPTVSVSLVGGTDTALAHGETATLKLVFSEQPQALPLVVTTKGSLSDWTRVSDTEYTATFRPANNISAGQVVWGMDTFKDLAGNIGSMLGNWPGLSVDTIAPTVTAVSDTTVASITKGSVRFVVTFSETLDTLLTSTHFSASNGTVSAVQASGNGLQYTVDVTPNANVQQLPVSLSLVANGVKDGSGNALANQDLSSFDTQLVDTRAPNLNGVTIPGNAVKPVYKAGEALLINFAFNEAVVVSGTPSVTLNVGGQDRSASYLSGSGTSTLVFAYTVKAGDTDLDGVSIAANAFQLQTGQSIADVAGNSAVIAHSAVSASANAKVDTTAPTVSLSANAYRLQASDSATVTLRFSEDPGTSFTIADLSLSGGSISAISGTGLTREVSFVPNANVQGSASLSVASGAFTDAAGNPNADGSEIDNRLDFSVDTLPPSVQSVAVFAADNITTTGWLNAGDRVRAKVVFSDAQQHPAVSGPDCTKGSAFSNLGCMPGGTCSRATHEGHSRKNSWVGGAATQDDICACLDRCNVWLWSEQGYDAIAFKKSIRVCAFKRRKSFDATFFS